jgi:3-deoxy-7-phosphoheptulonate synthase
LRLLRAYDEAAATLRLVRTSAAQREVDVWTSHEALLLDYEEALVRWDRLTRSWYGGSGHLLWLGERTRQPDGAHVAVLAGLSNAVACKLGPRATVDEVLALCQLLDPECVPGRLTLIPRLGADSVGDVLPPLVRAVRDAGHPVVWMCDPMHGNTVAVEGGRKIRHLSALLAEIGAFVGVLHAEGGWPGGVHLELTGEDVVECVDRPGEAPPPGRSTTLCDPRLNARQSIQLAHEMGHWLRPARVS